MHKPDNIAIIRNIVRTETAAVFDANMDQAIERGVKKALQNLGADAKNQHELQKDFIYLRQSRLDNNKNGAILRSTFFSVITSSVLILLWEGLRTVL